MNSKALTKHQQCLKKIKLFEKSNKPNDFELIKKYLTEAIQCGSYTADTEGRLIEFDEVINLASKVIKRKGLSPFRYPVLRENLSITISKSKWKKLPSNVKRILLNIALLYAQKAEGEYIISFSKDVCSVIVGTHNFEFADSMKNVYTLEDLKNHKLTNIDIQKIQTCYKNVRESKTFVDVIKNLGAAAKIEFRRTKDWDFVRYSLVQNQIFDNNPINQVDYIDNMTLEEWIDRSRQGKKISIKDASEECGME
jgi:hypothetical protein